jgi:hypothetical protein
MMIEQVIAFGVGALVFIVGLRSLWRLVVSYEYPLEVKGNRLREARYSVSERFDVWRVVGLLVGLPVLSAVVVYLLAVGAREVLV